MLHKSRVCVNYSGNSAMYSRDFYFWICSEVFFFALCLFLFCVAIFFCV